MATITKQTIRVDLTPGRVYPVLHVSQGDVGLEALEFYVYQNGQPFTIPSEVTAINIDGMTPVGVFSYPCTWTGNVVTAGLTATMTAERGIDICELALYDATNNKIGTCNFVIAVEESPYTNAHVSTSDMATIMAAATEVQQNTLLSKSWAVGDTGIRTGEDTNNSEYWANISESWAVGGTGKRTGEDTNNSEYWSGVAHQYANTVSFKTYDTVAQMVADTGLLDGGVCLTLGGLAAYDGAGATYKVTTSADVLHGSVALTNGLYATVVNGMTNHTVTPDDFKGSTDAAKLQNAIDFALANGYPIITLNRVYDLTGSTVYINKGITITDDVSSYSRKKLSFIGNGLAKLKKTDAGYMFDATVQSGDITFTGVSFIGDSTSNLPTDCVAMKVFNCANLIRITVVNCCFTWCGHVYYQEGPAAKTAQSIVSIGNLYAKNNIVAQFDNLYDGRFIGDTVEDGVRFVYSTFQSAVDSSDTYIRDLNISSCTIEGFANVAIQINGNSTSAKIMSNYFEGNVGHISFPRLFDGIIVYNCFHGRANLSSSIAIKCIEIVPAGKSYVINGNYCIEGNANTTLIYVNTDSPYYSASRKIYGANAIASGGTLSNVPDLIIGEEEIVRTLSSYIVTSVTDITANVKTTYSQITGGTINVSKKNGTVTLNVTNLVVSSAIGSGSYQGSISLLKPTDGTTHTGVLLSNASGQGGTMFVNDQGSFGLRIPAAGTYSGQIVWT
mgnify:CR=1 FL=1